MPNRSSKLHDVDGELYEAIVNLAQTMRHQDKGVGGYEIRLPDLCTYHLKSCYPPDQIKAALIDLHEQGRIYLQRWEQEKEFVPFSSDSPGSFFNDFRLLSEKPQTLSAKGR